MSFSRPLVDGFNIPFYVLIIILSALTGLYTSIIQKYTIDYEKMADVQERMKEFQTEYREAQLSQDEKKIKKLEAKKDRVMKEQLEMSQQQFKPMAYILVVSVPIFFWLLFRLSQMQTYDYPALCRNHRSACSCSLDNPCLDSLVYDLFNHPEPGDQEIPEYRWSLMRITVSGLPGSGTTSLSRYLSERHGFSMISAGEVFRQLAREHNMGLAEFGRLAEENPEFDTMIDTRQKEIAAGRDNIIIEGRLSGWMVTDADLKIWLFAPISCRIQADCVQGPDRRMTTRQSVSPSSGKNAKQLDIGVITISISGIISIYHIILNSEHWGVEGLGAIVDTAIMQLNH